jgi:protein PhnA
MKLNKIAELHSFFINNFLSSDPSRDEELMHAFTKTASEKHIEQLIYQIKLLLSEAELPLDELGSEANRWFGDSHEARSWLLGLLNTLEGASLVEKKLVKDSCGTLLAENDSVQVIKDLKVKGGASDLKRGTLIKKIHLIDDNEAVECRVDGSTLVIKTCFLKKA